MPSYASRVLCQSLTRVSLRPPTALISHHRHRSNKTNNAQLIEIDLDSTNHSQPDSPEAATVGIRKLEDIIHNMIVRRAAPDWLPFLPGYSYWVPPRASVVRNHRGGRIVSVLDHVVSSGVLEKNRILSDDDGNQRMSSSSERGWPSSAFFFKDDTMQVKLQDTEDYANDESNPEDEEE